MGAALSGRREPNADSTDEERLLADEKDQESADAIGKIFEHSDALQLEVNRLTAVGSRSVIRMLDTLSNHMQHYLMTEFLTEEHIFRASAFNIATEQVEKDETAFLESVRSDLQVDTLVAEQDQQSYRSGI
ncbi:hypothetical protein [Bifidobacterium crudilactis]|jgi:hypothetical protein|uniref:hypothetical protein n=1 Tax=Bifidobacterium crudilactis TaxID=327277 RepID=UPI0023547A66|nr:hypothetical protein [Bifidobacterium crudilactis]MCI2147977.1 hypothetical protein [Bifidobacterium crudilactis]MCI2158407.1 hypothetical protein [Bifidobacterium crudilactis]